MDGASATLSDAKMTREQRKVILASSLGTIFEWYDFYLYGSFTVIIAAKFFSQFPEGTRTIFALLAFAAGFLVRPFGALVFGRLGDKSGRKQTFLLTIALMGFSTFLVGVLPTAETVGILAPIGLILLRICQGLALGGEYGGAATYVAEHAPAHRRGFFTSFIQITATAGLLMSLVVIMLTQAALGQEAFFSWGWRIPFLMSIFLLVISVWIRLQLAESPAWQAMKDHGKEAATPLREAFLHWSNARIAIIALLGLTAGQAVVWYTGQFYALFFLGTVMKVDGFTANALLAWALILGCPFFVFFGWLSDRVGRKPVILGGCLAAALTYLFLFQGVASQVNPALHTAQANVPVVLVTDTSRCSFQFNPTGTVRYTEPCDIASAALARASVNYTKEHQPGVGAVVRVGGAEADVTVPGFSQRLTTVLTAAGYPAANNPSTLRMQHIFDLSDPRTGLTIFLLWWLVVLVTMVYGPIAAALVELFPTRIRYSGMSLPYHIGNGWFGGLLPATAFAMSAQTGSVYYGLWYPIVIALMTAVIGFLFVPETRGRDIFAEDGK